MLAKVHTLASRLTVQHKSRPVYAFGSSTPRELEYLTQLTREQKVLYFRSYISDSKKFELEQDILGSLSYLF